MALPKGVKSPVDYTKLYMSNELEGEVVSEKALSKKQQRFFGIVRAIQKGEQEPTTPETAKAAADMKKSDVKKYASTKHTKLPEKKKVEEVFLPEILDKKDVPHVKKLVKKLRDGSKTHAKQADDLEVALKTEDTAIESELVIQDWSKDDIKFTEIETIDIIKAKPLKESMSNWREEVDIDEGYKARLLMKGAKALFQVGKKLMPGIKTGAQRVTQGRGVVKKAVEKAIKSPKGIDKIKFPVQDAASREMSKNIQTKSIVNQVKKASDLSKKPVKGTTPVKVDLQKKIDFDKYIGKTPTSIKKKFVEKRPTGTFTDDAPKVKRETLIKAKPGDAEKTEKLIQKYEKKLSKKKKEVNMDTKLDDYLFGKDKDKPLKIFDKRPKLKDRKMFNPNEKQKLPNFKKVKKKNEDIIDHYDWRTEIDEDWQKVNRKDKTDGLSRKAVKAYRRENPGSKLQTAVTTKPSKLKKGSKSAKRRLSFCRRMKGMKKKLTSAKTRRDPDSRINKALRRWNC